MACVMARLLILVENMMELSKQEQLAGSAYTCIATAVLRILRPLTRSKQFQSLKIYLITFEMYRLVKHHLILTLIWSSLEKLQ